ncbi:MAG: hypothetical protein R3C10_25280 [Pirellulales bacterium]
MSYTGFEAAAALYEGDGNGDGVVDGLDYLLWASFYGDNPAQDPPDRLKPLISLQQL